MKTKPVLPRVQASRDVEEAVDYYCDDAGLQVALAFVDAVNQAYAHIGRHPGSGSPRYSHELDLPGLRAWRVKRYPHLVFYVEREAFVDVWRVLHGQRDIPEWMQDSEIPG